MTNKNSLHLLEKQSEHKWKIWTAIDKVVQFPDLINETVILVIIYEKFEVSWMLKIG